MGAADLQQFNEYLLQISRSGMPMEQGLSLLSREMGSSKLKGAVDALMATHGLGKGTVLNLLRNAGVDLRGQGQRNIDLTEAIDRYRTGWSLVKLGAAYDCDAETVRKALRVAGVALRKPWERSS